MYFSEETWETLGVMMQQCGYATRSAAVRSLVEAGIGGEAVKALLAVELQRVKSLRKQVERAEMTRFCTCGKPVRFDPE